MCDFTKLEKSAYYQAVWAIRHLQKMEIWEQYWIECGVNKERCKVIWSAAKRAVDVLPKLEES